MKAIKGVIVIWILLFLASTVMAQPTGIPSYVIERGIPRAIAAGTADALTASFEPVIVLKDKMIVAIEAKSANATTTPTFAPDGGTARTIVKSGGSALVAGDIPGEHAVIVLEYNLSHTRWELLNPAVVATTAALAANGANCTAGNSPLGVDAAGAVEGCFAVQASLACTEGYPVIGDGGTAVKCGAAALKTWPADLSTFICNDGSGNPIKCPTSSALPASVTATNMVLTTPYATLPIVAGSTGLSLSATQVSGTIISNSGQALADVNHTLPAAAAGYNFVGFVGTALAATNYYRFTAATGYTMCLDGTCGKSYVTIDTPTQGASVACYSAQVSSTGLKNEADLGIGTSANTAVKNTAAVEFDIAGTGYSKAIAETAPGNDTIPQNKYGAVAFDIGVNGTIDAIEASANATGYESAALAIAGIAAVEAAHVRLGTVTAISTEAGGFVFGTTALSAANTTVAYTDTAVYTKPYNWICTTGAGTWVTD